MDERNKILRTSILISGSFRLYALEVTALCLLYLLDGEGDGVASVDSSVDSRLLRSSEIGSCEKFENGMRGYVPVPHD